MPKYKKLDEKQIAVLRDTILQQELRGESKEFRLRYLHDMKIKVSDIARIMGVSYTAVYTFMRLNGIIVSKKNKCWSKEDDERLLKDYEEFTYAELARMYGTTISVIGKRLGMLRKRQSKE